MIGEKIKDYFKTEPTSVILMTVFGIIFGIFDILAYWFPLVSVGTTFPSVPEPYKAILGLIIITFSFVSLIYPKNLSIMLIYFLCAIRVSDAFFGAPVVSAFIWTGAALVCTYSMYRQATIVKDIETKIATQMNDAIKSEEVGKKSWAD